MRNMIIYHSDESTFQIPQVLNIFGKLDDASHVSDGAGDFCNAKCEFSYKGDQTTVRLSRDCNALEIDGTGIAGVRFAWAYHELYPKRLKICDTAYSFDITVNDFGTFEGFESALRSGSQAGAQH